MKSELTHISGCRQSLDIEIPAELVENTISEVARDLARKAKVPGFRPGKTPVGVVKSRFRDEIMSSMMNRLLPHGFVDAVQERKLAVVDGSEHFDEPQYAADQPLKFKVSFETYPALTIENYTGIPVEETSAAIEDAEVEQQLTKLRNDRAELIPVEEERPVREGDFAEISFHTDDAGSGVTPGTAQVEIGGATTLPEFTQNLAGARINDVVKFPVEYRADYPVERLAGKKIDYTVKVEGIKQKEIPELTDEFAEGLGQFKSVEELRQRVRQDMEAHKRERAREERRQNLLRWLEERNTFDVPETLVTRQIQNRMRRLARDLDRQGIDPRRLDVDWVKLQEEQRRHSVQDVKGTLILDFIANAEGIAASDDDVQQEIERVSRETDRPIEKVRELFGQDSGFDRLKFEIRRNKTLAFLEERASATKTT